ncbi:TfuA-like protein [Marinimicrobium locisalis]|uniref:TfuA-like protein n=1 Tax=Marinimicrobium locisalis TaxID=546022 RepID=UPI0032219F5D
MNKTIVYIGPSIAEEPFEKYFKGNIEFRAPVKRGDLLQLDDSIERVAIVDGVFHSSLAVSIREIKELINKGIEVVGSSSMGALRAAELYNHGMKGIGKVFELYRDGIIDSDADVALMFDPKTFRNITTPRISFKSLLNDMRVQGLIDKDEMEECFTIIDTVHYMELTRSGMLKKLKNFPKYSTLINDFIQADESLFDVKKADAIKLADYLIASDQAC